MTNRTCGDCTLCCYLLPTPEIELKANTHCQHECRAGCAIYDRRPLSCQLWSCKWLLGDDVGQRPDRSGYVVDMMPDFVTSVDDATGEQVRWPVHQVWVDPARPDAHRSPALRRWIFQQGAELGMATIVRWGNDSGMLIVPPSMTSNGRWIEKTSNMRKGKPHPVGEVLQELARQGISTEAVIAHGPGETSQATLRVSAGADASSPRRRPDPSRG